MGRPTVAGLFAGVGGIEVGLHSAGFETSILCEVDEAAQRVLRAHFPGVPLHADVATLPGLPTSDVVVAGFPCQDLSQAGRTRGIGGARSGLVEHVFRLLDRMRPAPSWLVLENVPFMLQLQRGAAMRYLVSALEDRGFMWAYRVVDTRAFGLPQRRRRVLLVASQSEDPRGVLFGEDAGEVPSERVPRRGQWCGFYWTEGSRGLGWAVDAVPTLKGGSTVGIPSPPAVWVPEERRLVTPVLHDAERLQGFPPGWTAPAVADPERRNGPRWRLVGNAVSVPVAEWLGERLSAPGRHTAEREARLEGGPWPVAAWGYAGDAYGACVSPFPRAVPYSLSEFLEVGSPPLSARATAGFLRRAEASCLRFAPAFLDDVAHHLDVMAAEKRRASA